MAIPPRPRRSTPRLNGVSGRRHLFGFSRKPDPWLKDPDWEPGFEKMLHLTYLSSMHDRVPPADQLVKAFNAFFKSKLRKKEPIPELQVFHAARTLKHLQEHNQEQEGFGVTLEDLQIARDALVHVPQNDEVEAHNRLARILYAEIMRRKEADSSVSLSNGPRDLLPYVTVLCQTGDTLEARALVLDSWKSNPGKTGRRMWTWVLKGFAQEKKDQELIGTLAMMEEHGVPFDARVHQVMTTFYALKNDIEATKLWYAHPIAEGEVPSYHTNAQIMRFCIRNNELDWGDRVFRSIVESNPNKKTWDVIFLWAAASGKGVDEIDRMMEVMVKRNPDDEQLRPDIKTINGLVEWANSRDDPYTAERYVALGQKWGMTPNALTYILQMDYRIDVGDIDGARATYSRLLGEDVKDNADLAVVNKFIRALCTARQVTHEQMMAVVGDLHERRARLEPETVAQLCEVHLRREELPEVIGLIKDHTFHYSVDQRAVVYKRFIALIQDRGNSTELAWDAYTLLVHAFDEVSVETRITLMQEFFGRGRSDMASHVFGHIRQHSRKEQRPTVEAYIRCFEGIGRAADVEALEMVHNMLKLDSAIEPTTRLYNGLMLAYTGCDLAERALEFWDDIAQSREGPSYNSIRIALRACEAAWSGLVEARKIWHRLKTWRVALTHDLLVDYIGVLSAHGQVDEACRLIVENAERWPVDSLMFVFSSPLLLPIRSYPLILSNQFQIKC